jgi:sugar lactone lactonase YvrE
MHQISAVYSGNSQYQASATVVNSQAYITSVVGAKSTGDGGPATAAMLSVPAAIALDNSGDLFIADSPSYCVIREVNLASGVITTVAGDGEAGFSGDGGAATAAQIGVVTGLAVDNSGHLFLADSDSDVVREVNLSSGIITTVAGQGQNPGFSGDGGPATAAQLDQPTGVAVDAAGHTLYIADQLNNRIRKVDLTASVPTITTVAGDGTAAYTGDGAAASLAELNGPRGLALDASGNVYIADTSNYCVREITISTGKIATVAGNGTEPNSSVSPYGGDGGQATAAQLETVQGVSVDASGNLLIATGDNRVRRVNASSHVITTVAGDGTDIYNLDGSAATACSVGAVTSVVADASGNLFLAESDHYRVREVLASNQTIHTVAGLTYNDGGQANAAYLDYPTAVAVNSSGNLFIADSSMSVVREVNMSTGIITTVAGNGTAGFSGDGGQATAAELDVPDGLAVDSSGNLYIADSDNCRVREVNLTSGIITTIAGSDSVGDYAGDGGPATAAKLAYPAGLLLDGAGHLYIADNGNCVVREVNLNLTTPTITTFAGTGAFGYSGDGGQATAAALGTPDGLAIDGSGDIYISDPQNRVIREVTPAGIISTFAGSSTFTGSTGDGGQATAAEFMAPEGLAVDASGNLFIADAGDHRIREVNISTGVINTVAGNGTWDYSGDGGPATAAQLNYPISVAADSAGHVFLTDALNHRVRELLSGVTISVSNSGATLPTVTVSDAGGTYLGIAFPASATLTGSDDNPVATLEGVGPNFMYYAGSTASGTLLTTVPTAAGTYTVVATFPGSPSYLAAQSAPVTFTIAKATAQLSVTESGGAYTGSPFVATTTFTDLYGDIVGSIEGVTPIVTYYAGSTATGTGTSTAPTASGTYTVEAYFPGSADYNSVLSSPVTFTISPLVNPTIGTEILGVNQPGFWSSAASTWTTSAQGLDGVSLISSTANGSKSSQAAWWFSMPAGTYDIAITYTASASLTTQLGLDLYDGVGHWIGQAKVNEQVAPTDFTDQGVQWKRLGSFTLTNNIFHISTWNSATDGAICISAIELRAVPMINDSDASGIKSADAFSTTGTWTTNTSGAFGNSHVSSSTAGSGSSTATWSLPVAAGSYELDATWVASSTLSTNVTYKIYDGATLLKSVSVNQRTAPSGVTDEGINWTSLGSFSITTQVTVTVTNSASDGQVCADAIRVRPAYQPTEIVNNGYPGSWYGGSWTTNSAGLFGDSLVSASTNGSKTSQAAWWFPCRPGTYEVDATWQPGSNLSTQVGFDVYNALKWIRTATINEQNAPSGSTDQGVVWQDLGTFTMTSNVLHVSTWNSPTDGAICVDGIRIIPVTTTSGSNQSAAMMAPPLLENNPMQPAAATTTTEGPQQTQVSVADASAGNLGSTAGSQILLGPDASGSGAIADPTASLAVSLSPIAAPWQLPAIDPRAVDSIDLSTALGGKVGQVLGLDDLDASLDALTSDALGARRLA